MEGKVLIFYLFDLFYLFKVLNDNFPHTVEVVKQLKVKKAKNVKDKNNIERMDLS